MAATKRIFREWQHPRASDGRFAKKGSPAWAARAFKAAQEAGVKGFSMTHGGERQERMQPFSSFSAPKKAAPPTKAAAPKKAAPGARRTVAQDAQEAINAKAVNLDVQTSEKDIESRYGKASKAVAARKAEPKPALQQVSDRIAEQRGLGGVAVPLDRKTRTSLSDRALKKADQMAAEQRGGIVEAPLSMDVPKVSDADFANRYGGAAKAVAARRSAASAGYTDPRDALLATRPGEGGQLGADILDKPGVDIRAVVDAIKAVPDSKNGATAYPDMDRTTLLALARIAGISGRGKSNAQIADALKAKDEARKMRLNPKGVGQRDETGPARPQVSPVAAAAAERAVAKTAPAPEIGYAAEIANFDEAGMRSYYEAQDLEWLQKYGRRSVSTKGKSKAELIDALIANDRKMAGLTKIHGHEQLSAEGRSGNLDRFEFAKGAGPKA